MTISPAGTGSGTGISDAADGVIDTEASDAHLSGTDVAEHKGLMNIALAISAQQVNYNVSGIGNAHLKFHGQVLAGGGQDLPRPPPGAGRCGDQACRAGRAGPRARIICG